MRTRQVALQKRSPDPLWVTVLKTAHKGRGLQKLSTIILPAKIFASFAQILPIRASRLKPKACR
jgi:hypothetical protein